MEELKKILKTLSEKQDSQKQDSPKLAAIIKRQTESEEQVSFGKDQIKQETIKRSRVVTDEMQVDEVKESEFANLVKARNLYIFKHVDPEIPNIKLYQTTL